MKDTIFYLIAGIGVFWIISLLFHLPMMYGGFLFVPLAICLMMLLFMVHDHENNDSKKTTHH